jgi:hypothetical protein
VGTGAESVVLVFFQRPGNSLNVLGGGEMEGWRGRAGLRSPRSEWFRICLDSGGQWLPITNIM